MTRRLHARLILSSFFTVAFCVGAGTVVRASPSDGTVDAGNRYAWSENAGWIDFGTGEGNVHVTDSALTGYAWSELTGWISLNCGNTDSCGTVDYKVTNNGAGTLSGTAWSENVGWIQFAPLHGGVNIGSDGVWSGQAWGENIGWIVFNCAVTSTCGTVDYKMSTDWRPASSRVTTSSTASTPSEGHGGGRRNIQELIDQAVAKRTTTGSSLSSTAQSISSSVSSLSQSQSTAFHDVPSSSWFSSYVERMATLGVISGYRDGTGQFLGEFRPGNPVTFAELGKMALLSAKKEIQVGIPANTSAKNDWSAPYIMTLENMGIAIYNPSLVVQKPATRAEVLSILLAVFRVPLQEGVPSFSDVPALSQYAPVIFTAQALGLVSGDTDGDGKPLGTVRPNDVINRAEVAKVLSKMIDPSFAEMVAKLQSTSQAAEGDWRIVNRPELNLRASARIQGGIVRVLPAGTRVKVLRFVDVWAEVETENGTKGFVSATGITKE